MNYEQLERLSKNPYYRLSPKQLQLLEEYRIQRFTPPVKHSTSFNKHPISLEEESTKEIKANG